MEFKELVEKALEIRRKYYDLEMRKYGREWTSEEIALGFVGDVGDLMKLIQSKEGIRGKEDVDQELAHELSDCLWSIIILANKYNIDLESAFSQTMTELDKRLAKG